MGTFTIFKLAYNDQNNQWATSLAAFCKLNFRYIYTITLHSAGDIDAERLLPFTSGTITKTPLVLSGELLVFASLYAMLGFVMISIELYKKHVWPRTTGVVVGFETRRRYVDVLVAYQTEDGEGITGVCNMTFGRLFYVKHKGDEVEITYSPRKPRRINMASNKSAYICGLIFLGIAAGSIWLMVFVL
jgi:hypothetical protein